MVGGKIVHGRPHADDGDDYANNLNDESSCSQCNGGYGNIQKRWYLKNLILMQLIYV